MSKVRSATFISTALTLMSMASSAHAQVSVPTTPLNDRNCTLAPAVNGNGSPVPPTTFPAGCSVDGTRTVTPQAGTVESIVPVQRVNGFGFTGTSRVSGTYDVNFSGNLRPDGIPVLATGGGTVVLDANAFFSAATSVNLTTRYTGTLNGVVFSDADAASRNFPYFQTYSNFQTTVSGINVSLQATPVTIDGRSYLIDVSTPNPAAIIGGNAVAINGRYTSTGGGALVFGRIQGTAALVTNAGVTPSPSTGVDGTANGGYFSPFALQYQTTSVETTRLDENGLTTPTVSVTDGIDLNNSRVRNVADAVAPGDAVNLRQLQAMSAQNAATISRLDVLEGSLAMIDSRLSVLDNRISSGAAIATAMSGNAFLPDMKFNLTANVATYDGAHAGSIQIGALVSRHVAINAGVASGFNRGGKTAARAGLTFGW